MSFLPKFLIRRLLLIFIIALIFNPLFRIEITGAPSKENLKELYYSLRDSGEKYLKEGDFLQAIKEFQQALVLVREIDQNRDEEIKCYLRLGLLYWNTSQLQESSECYIKGLSFAKKYNLKNREEECRRALKIYELYKEGKKHRSLGKYEEAIISFNNAILLAKKIRSKEHEVKCLRQLSTTYWRLNDLQNFFTLNKEALKIANELKHKKEQGRCLNNIGLFYWRLNHYSKALSYYEKALIIARALGSKEEESRDLNNIAIIYINLGNYDKALEYLMEVFKIDGQLRNDIHVAMDLNNIGEIYGKKGMLSRKKEDFKRALTNFYQSLQLIRSTSDKGLEVKIINNIGNVHNYLGNYCEALKHFQESYKKAKEIKDIEAMGMTLNNMGIVHFKERKYENAAKCLKEAVKISLEFQFNQILWEAYFWLGQCYERNNQYSKAVAYFQKSIDVIDNIRSQIVLDSNKAGFVRDKLEAYEFLINLLYELYKKNPSNGFGMEIFHVIERAKARAFLANLRESRIDIRERLAPKLKKEERDLSAQISSIMTKLSKQDLSGKMRKELFSKLRQTEDEYMRLISRMRVETPEVANLVSSGPCQVRTIQKKLLDKKTALIEYFLGKKNSFLILVTKTELNVCLLPPKDSIEKSIKGYLKILPQLPNGKFKGILAAERIFKELFSFAEGNIPDSVEKLIIVPDGILYYLPFGTLISSSQRGEKKYLIEKYNITYAPSSSSLLFILENKNRKKNSKGLLAFGNPSYNFTSSLNNKKHKSYGLILKELYSDQGFEFFPLPASQEEIHNLLQFFPKEKRSVYLKREANEDIIKKLPLKDYQVIHFACHGFLDKNFPFRSALVLTLDENMDEDGFLQVREIYNLRIEADLVVLSACQTGIGKLEKGEGILGLPRIFFYSGAKSVVSTLWKVNDKAAARFMGYFYKFLSQGREKAQAIQLAKLKMIDSDYSHPFYWGAFILNGDYSSKLNFK